MTDSTKSPDAPISWIGEWHNQYGSTLAITDDADQRIIGTFRTSLGDSGFAGDEAEIIGLHRGDCVHFAFSRSGPTGDTIASFTGLLREGGWKPCGT